VFDGHDKYKNIALKTVTISAKFLVANRAKNGGKLQQTFPVTVIASPHYMYFHEFVTSAATALRMFAFPRRNTNLITQRTEFLPFAEQYRIRQKQLMIWQHSYE
jgi:hypothetical protein